MYTIFLLYRHECFTGKYTTRKIHTNRVVYFFYILMEISISLIASLSLKLHLNSLVCNRNIFGSSSKVFGSFPKIVENVRLAFGTILGNLWKSTESGRQSSENSRKRRHQYAYIIKRTLHISSKIWILCSRGKDNISLLCCAHSWDNVLATRT